MRHLLRVILEPFLSEFTIIESEKLHELDFIMRKIDGERNLDRDHGEAQRLHFLRHPGMDTNKRVRSGLHGTSTSMTPT